MMARSKDTKPTSDAIHIVEVYFKTREFLKSGTGIEFKPTMAGTVSPGPSTKLT